MKNEKVVIKNVKGSVSINILECKREAKKILNSKVIPQVRNAEKIQNFDVKKCTIPHS